MKKERFIPSSYALRYVHEALGFVVYSTEVNEKIYAMGFTSNATNPTWHYSFKSYETLQALIEKTINELEARQAAKAERLAARYAPHNLTIGEIFRCSWGYDQTNVEFYQVIATTKNKVTLCEIAQQREETGFMSGECTPAPNHFIGKPFNRNVNMTSGKPSIKISSCSWAYLEKPIMEVNGQKMFKPAYFSSYA